MLERADTPVPPALLEVGEVGRDARQRRLVNRGAPLDLRPDLVDHLVRVPEAVQTIEQVLHRPEPGAHISSPFLPSPGPGLSPKSPGRTTAAAFTRSVRASADPLATSTDRAAKSPDRSPADRRCLRPYGRVNCGVETAIPGRNRVKPGQDAWLRRMRSDIPDHPVRTRLREPAGRPATAGSTGSHRSPAAPEGSVTATRAGRAPAGRSDEEAARDAQASPRQEARPPSRSSRCRPSDTAGVPVPIGAMPCRARIARAVSSDTCQWSQRSRTVADPGSVLRSGRCDGRHHDRRPRSRSRVSGCQPKRSAIQSPAS